MTLLHGIAAKSHTLYFYFISFYFWCFQSFRYKCYTRDQGRLSVICSAQRHLGFCSDFILRYASCRVSQPSRTLMFTVFWYQVLIPFSGTVCWYQWKSSNNSTFIPEIWKKKTELNKFVLCKSNSFCHPTERYVLQLWTLHVKMDQF